METVKYQPARAQNTQKPTPTAHALRAGMPVPSAFESIFCNHRKSAVAARKTGRKKRRFAAAACGTSGLSRKPTRESGRNVSGASSASAAPERARFLRKRQANQPDRAQRRNPAAATTRERAVQMTTSRPTGSRRLTPNTSGTTKATVVSEIAATTQAIIPADAVCRGAIRSSLYGPPTTPFSGDSRAPVTSVYNSRPCFRAVMKKLVRSGSGRASGLITLISSSPIFPRYASTLKRKKSLTRGMS